MHCRYCRAWNEEDEHRCTRCGRRLHAHSARPAPEAYPLAAATAPELEPLPGPETPPEPRPVTHQQALFRESPKVIPIPTLTPVGPEGLATRRVRPSGPRPRVRRRPEGQQSLDFQSRSLGMQVEAVIYCDAPVALPTHRIMAAALDGALVAIGLGLFLATFYVAGGNIVLNRQTAPLFVSIAALLALFYRSLWCLAGGDSIGMQLAGLRLINFDGYAPNREQRTYRLAASLLSLLAAGLGLVWALVDEENLTWHDHISKTFPTTSQEEID